MQDEIRSTGRIHRGASEMLSSRDTQKILGISATTLHKHRVRLGGRLGVGRVKQYHYPRSLVIQARDSGEFKKRRPPKIRVRLEWERRFGPIPPAFAVKPRDGDFNNVSVSNLMLVPHRKLVAATEPRARRDRIAWTSFQLKKLRAEYPVRDTNELAAEFGVEAWSVRSKARRLRLHKTLDYKPAVGTFRHPIGTERTMGGKEIVMVKVGDKGTFDQQWRKKHHLVWETANKRRLPKGYTVIFLDGNKRNFAPSNLRALERAALNVVNLTKFNAFPADIQKALRQVRRLGREIERVKKGEKSEGTSTSRNGPTRAARFRWTATGDRLLRRDYPTQPVELVAASIGTSKTIVTKRAKKLGLVKDYGATIARAIQGSDSRLAKGA